MSAFDNQYQNRLYADRAARQTGGGHNFVPEIGFSGANKIDFEAQNAIITKWGAKVRRELRSSARRFSQFQFQDGTIKSATPTTKNISSAVSIPRWYD